eukprot:6462329-Amphidinium_carterae.1
MHIKQVNEMHIMKAQKSRDEMAQAFTEVNTGNVLSFEGINQYVSSAMQSESTPPHEIDKMVCLLCKQLIQQMKDHPVEVEIAVNKLSQLQQESHCAILSSLACHSVLASAIAGCRNNVEEAIKDPQYVLARKLLDSWRKVDATEDARVSQGPLQALRKEAWDLLTQIVGRMQTSIEKQIKTLRADLDKIGGGNSTEPSASWKKELTDSMTWEELVPIAKKHLVDKKRGDELQAKTKKLAELAGRVYFGVGVRESPATDQKQHYALRLLICTTA